MISIYIAGASKEMERCRRWRDAIYAAPRMSLTFDWPQAIAQHDESFVTPAQNAKDELQGVLRADVFWLLRPSNHSTGAWTELGMAIVAAVYQDKRREIVVSGRGRSNIFADHLERYAITRCDTDEEAWTLLQTIARQS